jgi:hypothetical protein
VAAPTDSEPESAPTAISSVEEDAPSGTIGTRSGRGRFTTVLDSELDRADEEEETPPWVSLQTWVLLAAIVAVGLSVWYMLQPPSADRLYEEIRQITADKSIESYWEAAPKIDRFLKHYSDDPRSGRLREIQTSLELDRLETQFERQTAGRADLNRLLPVERMYLEALNYMRVDPELGMAKLEAMIALYDKRPTPESPFDLASPNEKCLELARRRLKQMKRNMEISTVDDLHQIQQQLDRADEFEGKNPERARKMREAVLTLYGHKPWAAPAVERARAELAETAPHNDLEPSTRPSSPAEIPDE